MQQTGIIILAAGASSRLGEPKQLLPYNNNNFIAHAIDVAVQASAGPIVVVLGSRAAIIKEAITTPLVSVVINNDWEEGMASSIRVSLSYLLQLNASVNSALFMVCDQPFVTTALLQNLIATQAKTGQAIVASYYSNTYGTPVLFDADFFPLLLKLKGAEGAKKIIMQHLPQVAAFPFTAGAIDIDAPEDYANLRQQNNLQA